MIITGEIFWSELNKYAGKYQFSFQFWGEGNNNVYIMKDDVDLFDTGGLETPRSRSSRQYFRTSRSCSSYKSL